MFWTLLTNRKIDSLLTDENVNRGLTNKLQRLGIDTVNDDKRKREFEETYNLVQDMRRGHVLQAVNTNLHSFLEFLVEHEMEIPHPQGKDPIIDKLPEPEVVVLYKDFEARGDIAQMLGQERLRPGIHDQELLYGGSLKLRVYAGSISKASILTAAPCLIRSMERIR